LPVSDLDGALETVAICGLLWMVVRSEIDSSLEVINRSVNVGRVFTFVLVSFLEGKAKVMKISWFVHRLVASKIDGLLSDGDSSLDICSILPKLESPS